MKDKNSNSYKILVGICSVAVTASIGYLIVWAGIIDSPGDPSSAGRMYTLENIYTYVNSTDSVVPPKPTGGFDEPGAEPGSRMHTLDDIFVLLTRAPATGQTTCWDVSGDPIPDCSGTGHDGDYQKGATLLYKYSDDGIDTQQENVLKDENTGLMWIRDHGLVDGSGGVGGNQDVSGTMNWTTALSGCEGLEYDDIDGNNQSDWRLPNVKELHSIVNYENYNKAIDGTAFPNPHSAYYWSSTSYANPSYHNSALQVSFGSGYVSYGSKTNSKDYYVRCVRGQ